MTLYNSSLTYSQAKALSEQLPSEERARIIQQATAAMPPCYSQEFRDCIKDVKSKPHHPKCATINEGYVADWDQMDLMIDAMPYCSEPRSAALLVGGALAAFTLGVGIGFLVSR